MPDLADVRVSIYGPYEEPYGDQVSAEDLKGLVGDSIRAKISEALSQGLRTGIVVEGGRRYGWWIATPTLEA